MARYSEESKERVREAADFVDLVSAYTELRRAGPNRYEGLCPFHEERTPSFGIDPERKLYHCFGCGASGDIFTFVEATQQVDFKGALEYLAERYGVELVKEEGVGGRESDGRQRLYNLLERAAAFYERLLRGEAGTAARRYLASRGVGEVERRRFRIGWAPEGWRSLVEAARRAGFSDRELQEAGLALAGKGGSLYDRFRGRVVFPLCDERGRVIGFGGRLLGGEGPKYTNSPDGPLYHKGHHLYAFHLAREQAARKGEVILCEGYMDVVALHKAGFENAVGLMGTALTDRQLRLLGRLARRVLIALDGDSAGQRATARAAAVARQSNLSLEVVPLPVLDGHGLDPAEVVERWGAAGFERALAEAVPLERFQVERILAAADLETAGGRDRALAELRGVVADLPPSALRLELVGLIGDRLGLSSALAERLLGPPAKGAGRRPGAGLAKVVASRKRAERTFLALCLAVPGDGERALAEISIESHLTDPLLQQAAAHLKAGGSRSVSEGDSLDRQLEATVAGLEAEAQALREASLAPGEGPEERLERLRGQLRAQRLQLELAALDRRIRAARQRGEEVVPLAARRAQVKEEFDRAQQEAHAGTLAAGARTARSR